MAIDRRFRPPGAVPGQRSKFCWGDHLNNPPNEFEAAIKSSEHWYSAVRARARPRIAFFGARPGLRPALRGDPRRPLRAGRAAAAAACAGGRPGGQHGLGPRGAEAARAAAAGRGPPRRRDARARLAPLRRARGAGAARQRRRDRRSGRCSRRAGCCSPRRRGWRPQRRDDEQADALRELAAAFAAAPDDRRRAARRLGASWPSLVEAAGNLVFQLIMNSVRELYLAQAELFAAIVARPRRAARRSMRAPPTRSPPGTPTPRPRRSPSWPPPTRRESRRPVSTGREARTAPPGSAGRPP